MDCSGVQQRTALELEVDPSSTRGGQIVVLGQKVFGVAGQRLPEQSVYIITKEEGHGGERKEKGVETFCSCRLRHLCLRW